MALKRQICLNNLPIITLIGGWILKLPFEMQLDLYIGTYSWPLIPTYFMNVPLGTIQILRNQKGGWVRQNAYVCLHGGWVGVARCLRNQKMTKKLFSNFFHFFFHLRLLWPPRSTCSLGVSTLNPWSISRQNVILSEKKAEWVGFQKNYVILKVGHKKWLCLITRWVVGVKKGQKDAYVIFEWSLIPLCPKMQSMLQ